ncbi:MAG: hypothetical protein J3K34DRAFT_145885 [Monoraphidium minutum]|nr:MAG: hypothetical protein J3K34DRAFT_145885 [Monoraphidium minutum]
MPRARVRLHQEQSWGAPRATARGGGAADRPGRRSGPARRRAPRPRAAAMAKCGSGSSSTQQWSLSAGAGAQQPRSKCWHVRGLGPLLRRHPSTWLVPLLVTLAVTAVGSAGVTLAAKWDERRARMLAQGFGDSSAAGIHVAMQAIMGPLMSLATQIMDTPSYAAVAEDFGRNAKRLLSEIYPNAQLVLLAPQAIISFVQPQEGNRDILGIDNLKVADRRDASLRAIERGKLSIQGPLAVPQGYHAILFRLPVFIPNVSDPNETFGFPHAAYNCTPCYDPATRSRFWGFATVYVDVKDIADVSDTGSDTRLRRFDELGYSYELAAPQPGGGEETLAASAVPPAAPVETRVATPSDLPWRLLIAPTKGWAPAWRDPMLAAVALLGILIGLLSFAILVSRRRLIRLVSTLRTTNSELAEEKERTDVLLARQLNLITCAFGPHNSGGVGGWDGRSSGRDSGSSKPPEEQALDQIEDMRRALNTPSGPAAQGSDELELLELLGEGAFGKVFKGIWRGSVVAIKVMILPARMSGKEKRARMALMEAAISSVVKHPNIVQTYTYTIQQSASAHAGILDNDEIGGFSMRRPHRPPAAGGGAVGGAESAWSCGRTSAASKVSNFEVCLVLEYCEKGSLRDALDGGAFYMDEERRRVNYAAVLDTAADVARAMLHLHRQQIIHSDLKARNVLLKGDGARGGRGAVAKVADFGLSVRIDHAATHVSEFQGTISHMAPETQLQRRITKSSDVYAFGITLWELYTGGHAFKGIPLLLLASKVSEHGVRPVFPETTPEGWRTLAERCWAADPGQRPCFQSVLAQLLELRAQLGGATPPLRPYSPRGGGGGGGGGTDFHGGAEQSAEVDSRYSDDDAGADGSVGGGAAAGAGLFCAAGAAWGPHLHSATIPEESTSELAAAATGAPGAAAPECRAAAAGSSGGAAKQAPHAGEAKKRHAVTWADEYTSSAGGLPPV